MILIFVGSDLTGAVVGHASIWAAGVRRTSKAEERNYAVVSAVSQCSHSKCSDSNGSLGEWCQAPQHSQYLWF